MRKKYLITLAATLAAAAVGEAAVGVGPAGEYLAVWDGEVSNERGTVRTLAPREYAYVSPGGSAFAVVSLREGALPPATTVNVLRWDGRSMWALAESGATAAYVSDSGAAALVTRVGPGPSATAHLDFFSAAGARTGEADIGAPGEAAFFPREDRLAVAVLGEETAVFDLASGRKEYTLPYARTLAAGPGELVFLVDREWWALYRDGAKVWSKDHGLYYPRLVVVDAEGGKAVVGAHQEIAVVSLADGRTIQRWEAPADYGVTDVAAAADFSSFAVGIRTLAGTEAAVWLDADLRLIQKEEHNVAQPSGASPAVAVLAGPSPRLVAWGQGWRATLSR